MERLTEKELYGGYVALKGCTETRCEENCGECRDCVAEIEAKKKLKAYEDLEEQGLLLRLPCKVGDYVWDLWSGYRFEVMGIELHMNGFIIFRCGNKGTEDYAAFYLDEIEDRWSLSEPQGPTKAEKALAEMG